MIGAGQLSADPTPDQGHLPGAGQSNHAPVVSTAAQDPSGNDGSELSASGAFRDPDNDDLRIAKQAGAGPGHDKRRRDQELVAHPGGRRVGAPSSFVRRIRVASPSKTRSTGRRPNVAPTTTGLTPSIAIALQVGHF
jgi:hypothetical protein